jgi:hypothetical protein
MKFFLIFASAEIFAKFEKSLPSESELYAKGEEDRRRLESKSIQEQFCQNLKCKLDFNDTHQHLEVKSFDLELVFCTNERKRYYYYNSR